VPAFRVKLGNNDLNCVDEPLNPTHLVTSILSAVSGCNCSHRMRVEYSSWSFFYRKSIPCPRLKYAS